MTPDIADIARRLRQTRADMIGTDDEQHYWDCHEAAHEIERLRLAIRRLAEQDATLSVCEGNVTVTMDATLTDAEREAIELVAEAYSGKAADAYAHNEDDQHYSQIAATLRGLLERVSGNAALSYSGQPASTPPADATPGECSVPPEWTSRPYWVDPPGGWRYGFPRLYDPAADGDMTAWMIANGYPEHLARQDLPCTFTAQEADGGPRS
jgi:hypothetical protein